MEDENGCSRALVMSLLEEYVEVIQVVVLKGSAKRLSIVITDESGSNTVLQNTYIRVR